MKTLEERMEYVENILNETYPGGYYFNILNLFKVYEVGEMFYAPAHKNALDGAVSQQICLNVRVVKQFYNSAGEYIITNYEVTMQEVNTNSVAIIRNNGIYMNYGEKYETLEEAINGWRAYLNIMNEIDKLRKERETEEIKEPSFLSKLWFKIKNLFRGY